MNHRHPIRAAIWILVNHRSSLFSTLPYSAAALRSPGPHLFSSKVRTASPCTYPLYAWHPLQATKGSRERINENSANDNNKTNNMIVRVRCNIGTVKLRIGDDERATEATIRSTLLEKLGDKTSSPYKLTQDLSFDPAGARKIHPSKTLVEQGLQHGCMVYCRVAEQDTEIPGDPRVDAKKQNQSSVAKEERPSGNAKRDEIVQLASKKETGAKKKDDVIDLMDSSDEEDTNDDDNDDDGDVEVISPRTMQSIRRETSGDSPASKPRKRQRSATDGNCSSSEPSNAGETSNGDESYPNFQMASYNVWFGPPDPLAKQVFPKERMAGIVESLRMACETKERNQGEACPLLFVGLQELTPNLVQYLQPQFQSIGYRLYTQPLGGFGPSYGVGIAISQDVRVLEQRFVPYRNSMQGRGFLLVRTPTLLFATTHLESWCGPQMTGSTEREFQIIEAARYCREQLRSTKGLELAIIAGDLNWDDERKRKPDEAPNRKLLSILKGGWKDAGTPFDYTYDAKENPMLNGHLRRRFDRCLFLSNPYGDSEQRQGQDYQSMGLEKIGKEAIPNLIWNKRNQYNDSIKKMAVSPSDHFGIVIHFSKTH